MLRLPAREICNANKYGDPQLKGRRSMRAGHDPLTDEGGIDLVDEAVEAGGTVPFAPCVRSRTGTDRRDRG